MNQVDFRIGHHGLNVSMRKFNGSGKVALADKKLNLTIAAMMLIKVMIIQVKVSDREKSSSVSAEFEEIFYILILVKNVLVEFLSIVFTLVGL